MIGYSCSARKKPSDRREQRAANNWKTRTRKSFCGIEHLINVVAIIARANCATTETLASVLFQVGIFVKDLRNSWDALDPRKFKTQERFLQMFAPVYLNIKIIWCLNSLYPSLMHLFIVLNRLLFLITHLNAQWNGTTGHYSVNNNLLFHFVSFFVRKQWKGALNRIMP